VLHGLKVLNVLILGLLSEGLKVVLHLLELRVLLLVNGLDHVAQLLPLHVVRVVDFVLLTVKLGLNYREVTLELLMEAPKARLLQCDQFIDMNKVVPQRHLVLLLGLVEVAVDHLKDCILRIDLSVVVLLVNLHLLLQLFCLGNTHDLTPVCENLHAVEMGHLLLLVHGVFQVVSP